MKLSCAYLHPASPQRPMPPPRKQWFDKLADAILGDEDSSVNVSASRYALICQKCFAHNGLVKESVWEDTRTFAFYCSIRAHAISECLWFPGPRSPGPPYLEVSKRQSDLLQSRRGVPISPFYVPCPCPSTFLYHLCCSYDIALLCEGPRVVPSPGPTELLTTTSDLPIFHLLSNGN